MVMVAIKCPRCGQTKVSKNGKTESGKQKYLCTNRECTGQSFLQEYTQNGSKPGIDEQIIEMAANASGIRDTARVLKVLKQKVQNTLKKQKS
jgi:transposase-like protein